MSTGDLAIIAAIAYQAWSGLRVGLVMGLFQPRPNAARTSSESSAGNSRTGEGVPLIVPKG